MSSCDSLVKTTCLVGALFLSSTLLVAENQHPSRVNYVDGTVAVAHEGHSEWELLKRNFPIWEGDRIFSERNSRVEVEFNDGTVVRLGSWTGVVFEESSSKKATLRLLSGDLIVQKKGGTPFEVISSVSTTELRDEGIYRFNLSENGETTVRVRKGVARTVKGSVSLSIRKGDAWRMGDSGQPLTRLYRGVQRDEFDEWSDLRESLRPARSPSSSRTSSRHAGSRDLNRYGQWGYVSSYGRVWWPHEKSEWIPYQKGRWGKDPLDRPVWISDEPWGWVPYHYGSWVYVSFYSRWCWVPGSLYRWQPARVNFYFGGGYLGWAPRGPGSRGSVQDQGRPHRQRGLTLIDDRDFQSKRITPGRNFPDRSRLLRPGLPPGLKIPARGSRHVPALRPSPRHFVPLRSTPSSSRRNVAKRSESSWVRIPSKPRTGSLGRRGTAFPTRSEIDSVKSERFSPLVRTRGTRPTSRTGKLKTVRRR